MYAATNVVRCFKICSDSRSSAGKRVDIRTEEKKKEKRWDDFLNLSVLNNDGKHGDGEKLPVLYALFFLHRTD